MADARQRLSATIKDDSPLFVTYMQHLLEAIVSKGDVLQGDISHSVDTELASREIGQLLPPLAHFVASNAGSTQWGEMNDDFASLQRDAWFNIVVHGFSLTSDLGKEYSKELQILARFSQPLIDEDRADQLESDVELNTVLRRGMNGPLTVAQKRSLIELFPTYESEIKPLNYPETIFLNAANLVETLRARSGDCTKALTYFLDPKLKSSAMGNCMAAVALRAVETYLFQTAGGKSQTFSTPHLAKQLGIIFTGSCHRVSKVQQVATACADYIIKEVPSALCQRTSLFALLDVLDVMWTSCLEEESDEYEWRSKYTSTVEKITIELSDDFEFRKGTLSRLNALAKEWVFKIINIAPLDVKGLLQVYLHNDCISWTPLMHKKDISLRN